MVKIIIHRNIFYPIARFIVNHLFLVCLCLSFHHLLTLIILCLEILEISSPLLIFLGFSLLILTSTMFLYDHPNSTHPFTISSIYFYCWIFLFLPLSLSLCDGGFLPFELGMIFFQVCLKLCWNMRKQLMRICLWSLAQFVFFKLLCEN